MPVIKSPTIRHRQLARTLKELRTVKGLSQEDAASQLGYSKSKILRIEGAQSYVTTRDLRDIFDVYGVSDDSEKERIVQLAKDARAKGWWTRYSSSVDSAYAAYIALEWDSDELYVVETNLIPGLLQTTSYTEAVIGIQNPEVSKESVEAQLRVRGERKGIFDKSIPPRLWVVLCESALYHVVGSPQIMKEQLESLLSHSDASNITIQVLPRDSDLNVCLSGPFTIMAFPSSSEPEVIYSETTRGIMYYEDPSDTETHATLFRRLNVAACDADKSKSLIEKAISEMERNS